MADLPDTTPTSDIINEKLQLPAVIARNERIVERGFWRKLGKVIARIPFAEEIVAAYFCATDRTTPVRVRAVLFGALAYFVLPTDFIPDFIVSLGFTDDATVLTAALSLMSGHIKAVHHECARIILAKLDPEHKLRERKR